LAAFKRPAEICAPIFIQFGKQRATKFPEGVSPISSNPIFSGNRPIFFEAATEVPDIEKIACNRQKMFFIPATMFLSNKKIILNMETICPVMEKII
jgi:hypothetical protein